MSDTGTGGVFTSAAGKILDTRDGTGGFSTPMPAGSWRTVQVAGQGGLPDDGSVGSVTLDVTTVAPSSQGQAVLRPNLDTPATLGMIYAGTGSTTNTVTVAVDPDGTIKVATTTGTGLVLELQGYYSANDDGTAPGGFVSVPGRNLVDTRSGVGAPKAAIAAGGSVTVQVGGQAGIPADASGVVANFIAINSTTTPGYLVPFAAGDTKPARGLNYAASTKTSVTAQIGLSADGKMTITNNKTPVDLAIDIQGYFTATGKGGAVFTPAAGRLLDTRATGQSIVGQNQTRVITAAGQAGIPVMGSGITAVALTITSVHTQATAGRAIMWADGTTMPTTTAITYENSSIRSNTVIVPLGANGKIDLYNYGDPTNYVLDLQGWYANPLAPTITCPSPYAAGAVTAAIPTEAVRCTVTVPAATESGTEVDIDIDGTPTSAVALSETATTTTSVLLPAIGGVHQIDATIVTNTYESYGSSSFSTEFGGDWPNEALKYFPGDGLFGDMSDVLAVVPQNDPLRDYVQRRFTVSTNPDGVTDPVLDSGWITDDFQLDASALTEGTRYYWRAELSGPTSISPTVQSLTTPVLSFIADEQPVAAECVIAADTAARASGVALAKEDVDSTCATTNTIDVDSAETATSDDIASDPGLSGSQKIEMMRAAKSSTIKSVEWQQHDDQVGYSEWQSGKFYYNGSKSWTNKYQNKTGWHRCHVYGSKTTGVRMTVVNCFEHRAGKHDEQTLSGEDYQVDVTVKGVPLTYVKNMSTTCGVTGTVTKKVNKR